MKLRHLAIDPAKPETIRRAIEDLRDELERQPAREIVEYDATSGTEVQRRNPAAFVPRGFKPLAALDAAGAGLGIASWAFNPTPSNGEGWYGITVTVTSGTLATVRGELVGG